MPWRPQTLHHPISSNIGILKSEEPITLYPGECLDIQAPPKLKPLDDAEVLVRPRFTSNIFAVYQTTTRYTRDLFPTPLYTWMINGRVRILNDSSLPITIPKLKHIADISLVIRVLNLHPLSLTTHMCSRTNLTGMVNNSQILHFILVLNLFLLFVKLSKL